MILAAATLVAWVDAAVAALPELLADKANREKKAASTALALLFAYPDDRPLCTALSRLAREELRHFEQVEKLQQRLGLPPLRLGPGRYAAALRAQLATAEPRRKLDRMLMGALIEARSCERFELLAPRLTGPAAELYAGLAESERRHGELYLQFAARLADEATWRTRLAQLASEEARLATSADGELRFHSGPPA